MDKEQLLSLIREAFMNRLMPSQFVLRERLADCELSDVLAFAGKPWAKVTCEELERHHEGIFWLLPKAFCYYLPAIFCIGIREELPTLLANYAIVGMLDRSPDPSVWDDFFLERWPLLNEIEYEAVQEWLLWLSSGDEGIFHDGALSRAFDCIDLVRSRKVVPLGG